MADSTANDTLDGIHSAVIALRKVLRRDSGLGQLARVTLSYSRDEGWLVKGQSHITSREIDRIDVLRSWAHALNGELELSEPRSAWPLLTAKATINGTPVQIWGHLKGYDTAVAVQTPELVAAHT